MANLAPLLSTIFGKSPSGTLWAADLARRLRSRLAVAESDSDARTASMSMREYHTSSVRIFAYSAMRSRYERVHSIAASRSSAEEEPFERAACTKLAARRLTSHS